MRLMVLDRSEPPRRSYLSSDLVVGVVYCRFLEGCLLVRGK